VLTLTAQAMQATASDFLAAGFDSYLSKPVNVVKLIHTVRQQCPGTCVGKARCLLDLLRH
jgi:CheY-like chemotaxis protein